MNLLKQLEGLRGENMVSATLSHLLMQSVAMRAQLLGLVQMRSAKLISAEKSFGVELEVSTSTKSIAHGEEDRGRIDLLIETDHVVIGIENKLDAEFQKNQLTKYLETLDERATKLADARGRDRPDSILVVLVPNDRVDEVETMTNAVALDQKRKITVIGWDDVLSALDGAETDSTGACGLILRMLREYLMDYRAFFGNLKGCKSMLLMWRDEKGSELQCKLIGRLWKDFEEAGGRSSQGKEWAGYYFRGKAGWYGFVRGDLIERPSRPNTSSEFIVVTDFNVTSVPDCFMPCQLKSKTFLAGMPQLHSWILDFDDNWSEDQWKKHLSCFGAAVT